MHCERSARYNSALALKVKVLVTAGPAITRQDSVEQWEGPRQTPHPIISKPQGPPPPAFFQTQSDPPPPQARRTPQLMREWVAMFADHVRNSTRNHAGSRAQKCTFLNLESGGHPLTPPPIIFQMGVTPPPRMRARAGSVPEHRIWVQLNNPDFNPIVLHNRSAKTRSPAL